MIPRRTLGKTTLEVSALGLGTTEIGFVYGIGPRTLPEDKEAIALLQRAVECGITFIDTANYYGVAEERIASSNIAKKKGVVIATKCGHVLDTSERITDDEIVKQLRTEVEHSLKTLRMETIDLVQIHGGTAEQIRSGVLTHVMMELRKEGKLRFIGISTRGLEAPLAAIADGNFDTLQLAHSILDQRMVQNVFAAATEKNIGIINRSVLLKGALTPARTHLAPSLTPLKRAADAAQKIADEVGCTLPELAVRFAIADNRIASALIGSSKMEHIESAVRAAEQEPLSEDILQRLRMLAVADERQVDPKFWDTKYISDVK
ncbi:aldo/keto reductase [Candidatus Peregrinibacteria bacterium]|nr:aldo/keto reductase [Candidatus Peregrinibacteria bacterium]